MTDKQRHDNLYHHVTKLCQILENRGINQRHRYINPDGEYDYRETKWVVDDEDAANTFLGSICHAANRKAYLHLKEIGALDIGVCWKCGESPIKNEYVFSSGKDISFFICKTCYHGGRNFQRQVLGYTK